MCGIAAVWGSAPHNLASAIGDRQRHRGPDGQGALHLAESHLSLDHRRLAIIDPQGGRQPLVTGQGRAALVANGMIYNDAALRASLPASRFSTASDSESILHSCLQRGADAVSGLDGMFAFVMAQGRKLMAARDPVGIKPLYVGRHGDAFCFASEIKALAPYVSEVHEFPPGHVFDSDRGLRRYFTLPPAKDDLHEPRKARQILRQTLSRAVEKRLRSDVPLGVFLSGGLDSSIIAALASQFRPGVKSFAVGLPGSPDLAAARRVAEHLDTDHHEYILSPEEIRRDLPRILGHLESFDQDLVRSAIPCFYVSRLAAEHVKVVLTGEGADELFAGYAYHKDYHDFGALQEELRRAVASMHNVNLQRVDRMTMAHGIEARVPFLDREMLDVAFRIPASLKLPRDSRIEKWILRETFEALLPVDIAWRDKAQFDQGSGVAELLQSDAYDGAAAATETPPEQHARSEEETLYRRLLTAELEQPGPVLDLVAHWDGGQRVPDCSAAERAAITPLRPSGGRGDSELEDFSALYDRTSARPYFRRMRELDYRIPGPASIIYRWCLDELRRIEDKKGITVLDLCAGYGVNGALMKMDASLYDLYGFFAESGDMEDDAALFDRMFLFGRTADPDVTVAGVDIAAKALAYACAAGFTDEAHAVNLETEPLPEALERTIEQCSVITVTGGFSFIGSATFRKILSHIDRRGSRKPWIVGFPPRHKDLSELIELLREYGYVIQPALSHRFRQRRFANTHEREREHTALTRAGQKIHGNTYFESRLLLAQPPGMSPIPSDVLERAVEPEAAGADASLSAAHN